MKHERIVTKNEICTILLYSPFDSDSIEMKYYFSKKNSINSIGPHWVTPYLKSKTKRGYSKSKAHQVLAQIAESGLFD